MQHGTPGPGAGNFCVHLQGAQSDIQMEIRHGTQSTQLYK